MSFKIAHDIRFDMTQPSWMSQALTTAFCARIHSIMGACHSALSAGPAKIHSFSSSFIHSTVTENLPSGMYLIGQKDVGHNPPLGAAT